MTFKKKTGITNVGLQSIFQDLYKPIAVYQ